MNPFAALSSMIGVMVGLYFLAPMFPFLYVIVRWRGGSASEPGVGTVAALCYFRSLAIIGGCVGVSLLFHALIDERPSEDESRAAYGILAASAVFLLVNTVLMLRIESIPPAHPARRVFTGFIMVTSGLVTFAALLVFFIALLADKPNTEAKQFGMSWGIVWLLAFLGSCLRLAQPGRTQG